MNDPRHLRAQLSRLRGLLQDRVTGLPSLPLLLSPVRRMLDGSDRVAVLSVRVQNLDMVESLYGWQVFDSLLRRVASGLQDAVSEVLPDEARIGVRRPAGEEFVIVFPLPGAPAEADARVDAAVRRLRARLQGVLEHADFDGLRGSVALVAGGVWIREDPFHRLERILYAAVDEGLRRAARPRAPEGAREAQLHHILSEAAVTTLFQPVVDVDSREPVGYEAFSRGPEDSALEAPAVLFPLSREVGVAGELDRICYTQAVRRWGDRHGRLFLNLAPATASAALERANELVPLLDRHGLSVDRVVLEIPERAVDREPEAYAAAARHIASAGFDLALDDVGTGAATLATLDAIRPRFVKIDVSVVRGVHRNPIKQDLLHALAGHAGSVGGTAVAEGVESEGEADAVARAGIRLAQGYWFSPPERAAERTS